MIAGEARDRGAYLFFCPVGARIDSHYLCVWTDALLPGTTAVWTARTGGWPMHEPRPGERRGPPGSAAESHAGASGLSYNNLTLVGCGRRACSLGGGVRASTRRTGRLRNHLAPPPRLFIDAGQSVPSEYLCGCSPIDQKSTFSSTLLPLPARQEVELLSFQAPVANSLTSTRLRFWPLLNPATWPGAAARCGGFAARPRVARPRRSAAGKGPEPATGQPGWRMSTPGSADAPQSRDIPRRRRLDVTGAVTGLCCLS